jgi:hypothetical protein
MAKSTLKDEQMQTLNEMRKLLDKFGKRAPIVQVFSQIWDTAEYCIREYNYTVDLNMPDYKEEMKNRLWRVLNTATPSSASRQSAINDLKATLFDILTFKPNYMADIQPRLDRIEQIISLPTLVEYYFDNYYLPGTGRRS